mmetsp:Transcript_73436/g.238839  ORF Transcript_73436/g.238839 Transcript_73436/m.238839 type:complete len:91 (+) Transcript_73436:1447-1719(+)
MAVRCHSLFAAFRTGWSAEKADFALISSHVHQERQSQAKDYFNILRLKVKHPNPDGRLDFIGIADVARPTWHRSLGFHLVLGVAGSTLHP